MLLYAITDRRLLAPDEPGRQKELLRLVKEWSKANIDYIQIREKDLSPAELKTLTKQIVQAVRSESAQTTVLLNGPAEEALAAGADGIHITGNAPPQTTETARQLYQQTGKTPILSQACHTVEEVEQATQADLILYAPVFEKRTGAEIIPGQGLAALQQACKAAKNIPVLALGGVTTQNAHACIQAGAAGIAAIRLFISNDWRHLQ